MSSTLQDLYVDELKDLYFAEHLVLKALPKMEQAASTPELRTAFTEHLEQTRAQVQRLERIFRALNTSPQGKECKGMEGIIEEGDEMLNQPWDADVKDAALISAAQRVEHYEIAGYGCCRTWAQEMGRDDDAELLQQTLEEEEQTDRKLTALAENRVNVRAMKRAA